MGKGSTPRPLSVEGEKFRASWDAIFRKPPEALNELVAEAQTQGDYDPPAETPAWVLSLNAV